MNKWINIDDMRDWLRDYATTDVGKKWLAGEIAGDVDDVERDAIAELYVNALLNMVCYKDNLLMLKFSEN